MAPSRRKGASKAAAAAAARRQWKVGDLVLAKVKGFPAWPATVSEPEKWGYSADWKKVLVFFFGTQQIAFCNHADVEPFTEEKKQSLLTKRHGKGSDFVRAVQEIIDSYEKLKKQNQTDDYNSEQVDINGGNMASSSAKLGSNEKLEAPEATFDSRFSPSHSTAGGSAPNLPVEDTSASALVDDVDKKEEPTDTTVVTDTPLHTVYSSRKRTRELPLQNGDSKEPLVRRSRSSSRLESRRLRDSVVQFSDTGRSSGTVSDTVDCDGFLTRNKSKRKAAEASESDDPDLSAFASSGSIEDNGSDVVTVESDSISLNEGSTVDSDCKMDHSEAVVGCFSGDLQIKAVIKKKRKPTRKRPTTDSVEPIATVDKEVGVPNSSESCQNDFEKMSVSGNCLKKDGDEHLPLVKRARVRMGELSSLKEPNNIANTEETAQKEHMMSVETNKSSICDDRTDKGSLMMNSASNDSPLKGCTQFHGNKPNNWKAKKDQSFGCSVDGEAALPPSKRLHRALEAMSANAAEEGQLCNDESPDMNTLANGYRIASMSRSYLAVEGQMATVQNVDSIGSPAQDIEASGFPTSFSPIAGKNTESTSEADFNDQGAESSNSQNNDSGKELLGAGRCADEKSPCGGSDDGEMIPTVLPTQSPKHLLSSPDRKGSDVRSAQGSEDELLPTKDKDNTEVVELINYRSEKTEKIFDLCKGTAMNMDPVSAIRGDLIEASPECGAGAFQSNTDGACLEKSRSSELPLDDSREENDMSEVVTEVVNKQMQKEPSSVSFPNGHVVDVLGIHSSPSVTDGGNSQAQASPHNASSGHLSTSDNSSFVHNNGSCSPDVHLHHKVTSLALLDEGKSESMVSQRPKSVGKHTELNAALSSFEAMLGSLTRTKESIGRATRVAIECSKLGLSSKVIDILAHCLETESSLHRRVDLFFLVDSILKGDVGGLYPSIIQAMLPRLLAASAPPGNSAHENRRQCLKVLRLWLERKILSESVICRHMRELDSQACSSAGPYSRRSLRTQRSFDDPLREMEGMLVDEYGSNSSFQLPGFCMPSIVKDEDGGSDSDGGSFEAVAPEHSPEKCEDYEMTSAMEKHRHILEDVDGELEMEDVAPSCELELNSSSAIGAGSAQMSQNQFEQHFSVPFPPPLPQDVPPSSPPLPSSPPPLPLVPLPPPIPPPGAMSDPYANGTDSHHYADSHVYADSHNMQENLAQSNAQQSNTPRINRTMSEGMHYHGPDCRDQRQMHEPYPDPYFHNKGYPSWPPHPPPGNQFSYGRGEPHFKPRREAGPPPPYSNRHHYEQYWDRENFYNNHERMEQGPLEPHDNWRFPPHYFSGPRYPGKGKFYGPDPFVGPPCEERFPNPGWRFPPRSMNHRDSMPFRPPHDGRIPVSNRGPGYWRPR